jgi:hypothetical protein
MFRLACGCLPLREKKEVSGMIGRVATDHKMVEVGWTP